MSISMYNASVGVYLRILRNLSTIVGKAGKWVEEKKLDPNAILQARLAPDMFTFTRQIQIATDMAKGTAARLAGQTPPSYEDNETTFAELQARLSKTIAFLESLQEADFAGAEERQIVLPLRTRTLEFKGLDYLQGFGTPNVYFHYSMAYALLRHNGLDLGKSDYIGA